jgi:uncharacterized membrane protein
MHIFGETRIASSSLSLKLSLFFLFPSLNEVFYKIYARKTLKWPAFLGYILLLLFVVASSSIWQGRWRSGTPKKAGVYYFLCLIGVVSCAAKSWCAIEQT